MTPEYKYRNDPKFHMLVDYLEAMIGNAEFSPTEVRQAAMLACIKVEMKSLRFTRVYSEELVEGMKSIRNFLETETPE